MRNSQQTRTYDMRENNQRPSLNNMNGMTPSTLNPGENKGAIRSAMKFDYELAGVTIPSSKVKQTQIPSANVFSCMDNPNYERDF